jgi:arylsulfatase A-like enzyme
VGGGALLALLLGLGAIAVLGVPTPQAVATPSSYPNVLVVTVAGLRTDVVGAYGGGSLTPNLDATAKRGGLFVSALAPSDALAPSAVSILSGLYPERHGLRAGERTLEPGVVALPTLLSSYGYRTAAFVSAPALSGRGAELAALFDDYEDATTTADRFRDLALVRALRLAPPGDSGGVLSAEEVARSFRSYMTAHSGGPWFAWVQLSDAWRPKPISPAQEVGREPLLAALLAGDGPLPLAPSWAARENRRRPRSDWLRGYVDGVRRADAALGRMVSLLNVLGQRSRTLVVVTAEMALPMGEGGAWFEPRGRLSERVLHVPWILEGRVQGVEPGVVVPGPTSLVDVYPTILGLIGVRAGEAVQGEDLSRYLGEVGIASRSTQSGPVFSESTRPEGGRTRAVRLGPWKLVLDESGHERLMLVEGSMEGEIREPRAGQARIRDRLSDILTSQIARERQRR